MDGQKRTLTIKELADLAGISTSALRAWERRFAIFSPNRTQGGHRVYTLDDLRILWFVKRQQALGMDLREISREGHDSILAKADAFFSIPSEATEDGPTERGNHEGAILEALKANDFSLALKLLGEACTIFSSAKQFVAMVVGLDTAIDEAGPSVTPFLRNVIRSHTESLLLHRIEQTLIPANAPLAVATLLGHNGTRLKTLCALLLARAGGFNTLFLNDVVSTEEMRTLAMGGKVRCLIVGLVCAQCGTPPPGTFCPDLGTLARNLAPAIAPYALTVLVPEYVRHLVGAEDAITELRYMHIISDWNQYADLIQISAKDTRLPSILLSEFQKEKKNS